MQKLTKGKDTQNETGKAVLVDTIKSKEPSHQKKAFHEPQLKGKVVSAVYRLGEVQTRAVSEAISPTPW